MLNIGCHLSSSEGYLKMGTTALEINANTFAFFTRNPRGGAAKEIIIDDVNAFNELSSKNNFAKLVAHAPYTLNPCSAKVETREYALELISDDLKRMEFTPNNYYNFHPGSHTGQGVEIGIEETAELLNKVLTKNQTTIVLLETMAGKGSEIGSSFEELQAIIDKVELKEKVGVCFDTCHTFDSGYDIVNDLDGVLKHFDDIIGLEKLYAIHLNDSMYGFESHKDRHAKIGEGLIGIDAIKRIINHPSLRNLPFILETPNEVDGYKNEIVLLKSLSK